jgi:hypothetical protein
MKIAKSLAAAAVLAAASFGSSAAYADDISHGLTGLAVLDGVTAHFGATFEGNNQDNTFSDRFVFSIFGAPSNLDAGVLSFSDTAALGLDITGLSLYSWGGDLIATGSQIQGGNRDIWDLNADSLAVGNYYLQVSGTVVSNQAASFSGQLALNPVPEPETYGMMLAGLGVLGFMARRRKAAKQ